MSIKVMTTVWSDSPYKGTALLIHLALADFASDDGICYPHISTLAHKARCSRSTAYATIDKLVTDGFMEVLEAPERGRYARAGRYQLIVQKLDNSISNVRSSDSIVQSPESAPTSRTVIEPSPVLCTTEQLSDFEDFWAAYGRIGPKKVAFECWKKAVKSGATPDEILAGLHTWLKYWSLPGAASMKWPQGWLNERRWEASPPTPGNFTSKSAKTMDVLQRLAQRNN